MPPRHRRAPGPLFIGQVADALATPLVGIVSNRLLSWPLPFGGGKMVVSNWQALAFCQTKCIPQGRILEIQARPKPFFRPRPPLDDPPRVCWLTAGGGGGDWGCSPRFAAAFYVSAGWMLGDG